MKYLYIVISIYPFRNNKIFQTTNNILGIELLMVFKISILWEISINYKNEVLKVGSLSL